MGCGASTAAPVPHEQWQAPQRPTHIQQQTQPSQQTATPHHSSPGTDPIPTANPTYDTPLPPLESAQHHTPSPVDHPHNTTDAGQQVPATHQPNAHTTHTTHPYNSTLPQPSPPPDSSPIMHYPSNFPTSTPASPTTYHILPDAQPISPHLLPQNDLHNLLSPLLLSPVGSIRNPQQMAELQTYLHIHTRTNTMETFPMNMNTNMGVTKQTLPYASMMDGFRSPLTLSQANSPVHSMNRQAPTHLTLQPLSIPQSQPSHSHSNHTTSNPMSPLDINSPPSSTTAAVAPFPPPSHTNADLYYSDSPQHKQPTSHGTTATTSATTFAPHHTQTGIGTNSVVTTASGFVPPFGLPIPLLSPSKQTPATAQPTGRTYDPAQFRKPPPSTYDQDNTLFSPSSTQHLPPPSSSVSPFAAAASVLPSKPYVSVPNFAIPSFPPSFSYTSPATMTMSELFPRVPHTLVYPTTHSNRPTSGPQRHVDLHPSHIAFEIAPTSLEPVTPSVYVPPVLEFGGPGEWYVEKIPLMAAAAIQANNKARAWQQHLPHNRTMHKEQQPQPQHGDHVSDEDAEVEEILYQNGNNRRQITNGDAADGATHTANRLSVHISDSDASSINVLSDPAQSTPHNHNRTRSQALDRDAVFMIDPVLPDGKTGTQVRRVSVLNQNRSQQQSNVAHHRAPSSHHQRHASSRHPAIANDYTDDGDGDDDERIPYAPPAARKKMSITARHQTPHATHTHAHTTQRHAAYEEEGDESDEQQAEEVEEEEEEEELLPSKHAAAVNPPSRPIPSAATARQPHPPAQPSPTVARPLPASATTTTTAAAAPTGGARSRLQAQRDAQAETERLVAQQKAELEARKRNKVTGNKTGPLTQPQPQRSDSPVSSDVSSRPTSADRSRPTSADRSRPSSAPKSRPSSADKKVPKKTKPKPLQITNNNAEITPPDSPVMGPTTKKKNKANRASLKGLGDLPPAGDSPPVNPRVLALRGERGTTLPSPTADSSTTPERSDSPTAFEVPAKGSRLMEYMRRGAANARTTSPTTVEGRTSPNLDSPRGGAANNKRGSMGADRMDEIRAQRAAKRASQTGSPVTKQRDLIGNNDESKESSGPSLYDEPITPKTAAAGGRPGATALNRLKSAPNKGPAINYLSQIPTDNLRQLSVQQLAQLFRDYGGGDLMGKRELMLFGDHAVQRLREMLREGVERVNQRISEKDMVKIIDREMEYTLPGKKEEQEKTMIKLLLTRAGKKVPELTKSKQPSPTETANQLNVNNEDSRFDFTTRCGSVYR